MALTSINIKVDETVKKEAESLFSELGLNMTTAVNAFFRQAVREQSLPFVLTVAPGSKTRPIFGLGKGKMWMADDFDEPLEELREYME